MAIQGNNFWEIIKPAETTNLVQNPSIEKSVTGYAAAGSATAASTSASQFFGTYGLQVTPASSACDGVYYGANSLLVGLTSGCVYAFSLFFKGQANVPYEIYFASSGAALVGSALGFTATGSWERKSVTYAETSTASRRLYVTKNNDNDTNPFIIDGLQCERVSNAGASPTTYCDGEQPGCIWLANPHGSKAWRDGQSRAGGEIINLNRDYDIIVRQQPGAGMPPVENVQTDLGIQDGGLFQRTKTQVRSITLEGIVSGSDVADFHYNRNRLVDLFKPDGGAPIQPFLLRYSTGSAVTKQIEAHYDGGFEMNQVTAEIETFSARLIAYDPYWTEIKDSAVVISKTSASFSDPEPILLFARLPDNASGSRGQFVPVLSSDETTANFKKGPDNKIYAHTSTTLFRYNPQSACIETVITGCFNGSVTDFDFDPGGNIYFCGAFTTAGSVTACRVAKFDGNDFQAVGDGFDAQADVIAIDRNNTVYVGGIFGATGSVAASGFAQLTSGCPEFRQVGDGLQNSSSAGAPVAIGLEKSGSRFYVGGQFDASGSVSLSNLAYFNGSEFQNVGSACLNGTVNVLAVKPDDTVFIGGSFSGVFPDGAGSPQNLTYWDGLQFSIDAVDGPLSKVTDMSYSPTTGKLTVGTDGLGDLPAACSISDAGVTAIWNGSVWEYGPFWHTADGVSGLYNQDVFLVNLNAEPTGGEVRGPQITMINNGGTATAKPELIFTSASTTSGSTPILLIENISASKNIEVDLSIWGGETITLSLDKGRAESDFRGNIVGNIRPGSNFTTWGLLPGNNLVGVLTQKVTALDFIVRWKNRYWSIDG